MTIRPERVRGIVFDLDKTLIVSQSGFNQALRAATDLFADYVSNHHEGRISKREIYRNLRPVATSFEKQGLYNRDEWWLLLLERLGLPELERRWVHRATEKYWREYIAESPPYHDAERTVRTLHSRGYVLGMVSDSDGTLGMKRRRIRSLKFYPLFKKAVVVAGDDTPNIKPDKRPFILVAKRMAVSPEECVYVGDNPMRDVSGARAVGMQTIIVRRRKKWKGARPDLVIDRLGRLLGIFVGPNEPFS